jgi:predicted PurR-regulated permease PerM
MDESSSLVPGWLDHAAAVGWRLLATLGMGVVLLVIAYAIPVSTTAILVSLVFGAALAPTVIRLRDHGLPRPAAAAVGFAGGALLVVGTFLLILLVVIPDLRSIGAAVDSGIETIRMRLADAGAPPELTALLDQWAHNAGLGLAPDVSALAGVLADVGTVLVLGTFLTYFLLADGDKAWAWAMANLRPEYVPAVSESARVGLDRVAWYVRRTALLAAIDGIVVGVVLGVLGVPLAGSLAAIAFVAGFVPYLGAIAGGAIVLFATLALAGPVQAILVILAVVGAWLVATRLIASTALGRVSAVNPILVLVAFPAGLALFGILGLLALLPVAVFATAIWRSVIGALDIGPMAASAAGGGDTESDSDQGIPLWLDRVAQWSWRGLVLAGLAWLVINVVVAMPTVVVPAVIAIVGAATLLPIVDRLEARGWGRGLASAASTIGVTAAVVLALVAAVLMTIGPMKDVVQSAAEGAANLDLSWLRQIVTDAGQGFELDVGGIASGTIGFALALLLALLMTFFMLRDGRSWWNGLVARLVPGRRGPVGLAGHRAVDVLSGYMVGTAIISAFGGITSGLVMVILGLPLAVPIAVIGFFAGFIPYIGSFITTAIALLVTVALGTTADIVWMLVFTVVFNIVQGNFVTPLVYGRSLSLHPAIVLMAIPVGNEIAGVLGMFLVVPVAGMVAATWRLLPAAIDASGLPPTADEGGHEDEPAPTAAEGSVAPARAGT